VELSKNAVKNARLNKKMFGFKDLYFYNTSVESFKTKKKYKLIMCFEVLEHLKNDVMCLNVIKKCMDNNSILAISVPSLTAPLYRLGLLKKFDIEVGHLRRYSIDSIRNTVDASGFEIIEVLETEGLLRNLLFTNKKLSMFVKFMKFDFVNNFFTYFDNKSVSIFGASQLILIIKKK